ncbi:hypothetical protein ACRALDRAFT_2020624 [Sodiomyces alcalophilus JCM 7366]|uniref:uncharacterized protein n=1 Tax=Sodiomyces alcalophilus JCM 7366 TaxID=591952 RepID=UPI0039B5F33E
MKCLSPGATAIASINGTAPPALPSVNAYEPGTGMIDTRMEELAQSNEALEEVFQQDRQIAPRNASD